MKAYHPVTSSSAMVASAVTAAEFALKNSINTSLRQLDMLRDAHLQSSEGLGCSEPVKRSTFNFRKNASFRSAAFLSTWS